MRKSMKLTRGILTTTLLAITCGRAGLAQNLTVSLSSAQVACNEGQLGRLLARTTTTGDSLENPGAPALTTLVSYSNAVGFYNGVVLTDEGVRCFATLPPLGTPEYYLAFNINPSLRTLLLNPERPQLDQMELSREETSSNFVKPNDNNQIILAINPTLADSANSGLLTINNFFVPPVGSPYNGFIPSSTKPGRGLSEDGLLTSCHAAFTAQDRKIFAILQRMVRVSGSRNACFFDAKIAIFRGEDAHTYRIDAYIQDLNGVALGKVAAVLRIDWTSGGALTSGTLSVLPACPAGSSSGCSTASERTGVFLIAPVFGGSERQHGKSQGVVFDPVTGPSAPVPVDFDALLRDSTWNG